VPSKMCEPTERFQNRSTRLSPSSSELRSIMVPVPSKMCEPTERFQNRSMSALHNCTASPKRGNSTIFIQRKILKCCVLTHLSKTCSFRYRDVSVRLRMAQRTVLWDLTASSEQERAVRRGREGRMAGLSPDLNQNCKHMSTLVTNHHKKKIHGLSPRANYTYRATAACKRSDCQLFCG
jgi:hypothetical protein